MVHLMPNEGDRRHLLQLRSPSAITNPSLPGVPKTTAAHDTTGIDSGHLRRGDHLQQDRKEVLRISSCGCVGRRIAVHRRHRREGTPAGKLCGCCCFLPMPMTGGPCSISTYRI
uniref:Uncharacterized protein n=1 Tax=Oryza glumipatula TaxID=40148 RepID=A0A0E0AK96_9ORYZ